MGKPKVYSHGKIIEKSGEYKNNVLTILIIPLPTNMGTKHIKLIDKGIIAYGEALLLQQKIRESIKIHKQEKQSTTNDNVLILCEHTPVLTYGSSAKESELFIPREKLHTVGLDIFDIKRGGAITFHGIGQIVGYPVLDLENFRTDVRWYIKSVAEVIIRTLADYNIKGYYDSEFPGVWIHNQETDKKRKICAIGVHLSRWVSNHGFAFNVSNTMDYYQYFVPCGITQADREVTTLERELGKPVRFEDVKARVVTHFASVFSAEIPLSKA